MRVLFENVTFLILFLLIFQKREVPDNTQCLILAFFQDDLFCINDPIITDCLTEPAIDRSHSNGCLK